MNIKDRSKLKGRVELFFTKGKPVIHRGKLLSNTNGHKIYDSSFLDFRNTEIIKSFDLMNIIVDQGKDEWIKSLTTGFVNVIARMAIGDRGTLPSDSTIPKVPTADRVALYNETYRDDIDVTSLNIGTPGVHEIQFTNTFASTDVPITSFSNQTNPVVNEVGLILCDLLSGNPLPRPPVAYPGINDADEKLFSIRTFKSVPFEAANDINVTVRYTIFLE